MNVARRFHRPNLAPTSTGKARSEHVAPSGIQGSVRLPNLRPDVNPGLQCGQNEGFSGHCSRRAAQKNRAANANGFHVSVAASIRPSGKALSGLSRASHSLNLARVGRHEVDTSCPVSRVHLTPPCPLPIPQRIASGDVPLIRQDGVSSFPKERLHQIDFGGSGFSSGFGTGVSSGRPGGSGSLIGGAGSIGGGTGRGGMSSPGLTGKLMARSPFQRLNSITGCDVPSVRANACHFTTPHPQEAQGRLGR